MASRSGTKFTILGRVLTFRAWQTVSTIEPMLWRQPPPTVSSRYNDLSLLCTQYNPNISCTLYLNYINYLIATEVTFFTNNFALFEILPKRSWSPSTQFYAIAGANPYFFNLPQTIHVYDHIAIGTTIFTVSAKDDDYDYGGISLTLPTSSSYFTITTSQCSCVWTYSKLWKNFLFCHHLKKKDNSIFMFYDLWHYCLPLRNLHYSDHVCMF